jgi:predicted Zn-dependent protease
MLRDGKYSSETAARYGYALALSEAGDFDRARIELDKLLNAQPNIVAFQIARARLEQRARKLDVALHWFDKARHSDPASRAATYGYVSLLSNTGSPREARQILRDFGDPDRRDPRFYKLLAEAEERMGDKASSAYDLAEYYRSVGELELAAQQLKLAQTIPDISHYQRLRVDARLVEIEKDLDRLDADRAKRKQREEQRRRN